MPWQCKIEHNRTVYANGISAINTHKTNGSMIKSHEKVLMMMIMISRMILMQSAQTVKGCNLVLCVGENKLKVDVDKLALMRNMVHQSCIHQ